MYVMKTAGLTNVGRLRKNNEDNFTIDGSLLIVADGMGGAAAGEIASSTAVNIISDYLRNITYTSDSDAVDSIEQAIFRADSEIKKQTKENPHLEGMGTTVVVTLHFDSRVLIGNIGDSRAYLITNLSAGSAFADLSPTAADASAQTAILQPIDLDITKRNTKQISRITEDHSVVMELVRSGIIDEEGIRTHPLRNRITRCLGSLHGEGADIGWHNIHDRDVLIMCSDGLWELVHEDIILAIVSSSQNMEVICKKLIEAANDAGGSDNITVIAAQFLRV